MGAWLDPGTGLLTPELGDGGMQQVGLATCRVDSGPTMHAGCGASSGNLDPIVLHLTGDRVFYLCDFHVMEFVWERMGGKR